MHRESVIVKNASCAGKKLAEVELDTLGEASRVGAVDCSECTWDPCMDIQYRGSILRLETGI
jgi:hypothetical protein